MSSQAPIVMLTAVRNESHLIGQFLAELHQVLVSAGLLKRCRLIVVDDCSVDDTAAAALNAPQGLAVEVLKLSSNRGNQSAMAWAVRALQDRLHDSLLITFDADGEDDLTKIPDMVRLADRDPGKIVFVTRDGRSDALQIRAFYLIYRLVYRFLTAQKLIPCNMMVIPGRFVPMIAGSPFLSLHFSYPPLRLRLPHLVLPLARRPRYGGNSSQNIGMLIQHGLIGLTIFYEEMVARMILMSAASVAFTALMALAIIYLRFFAVKPLPTGFATAVFVSLLGFAYLSVLSLVVFCLVCATLKMAVEARRPE